MRPSRCAKSLLYDVCRPTCAQLWYHRIPPALCYEIDAIKGTPLLPPRPGTTDRDLSTRSEELATQSLLLVIYAQAILLVLHRPFLHSTIWQVEIAHTAERQVFNSALTIVLARCRLGAVPLSFWADTFAFQAALTLAHLSGRFLTGVHQRRAELDAARAGLRAAIEHFSNVPGAQHEEKARVLTVLEAVLQCVVANLCSLNVAEDAQTQDASPARCASLATASPSRAAHASHCFQQE